ncbi:hypothetical protein H8356DRAFT_963960 [Neocallimastix lanati (nom. inval.)]|jgi:hypothetical protein|uniref:Uncharacterized protein n=1 Tax=Neocallimastix californiae TaxID=1754190 RepID=A0A1Y2CFG4_9FUNG|nr:hypothetical protein H8356DRAFT_963960 [Neocallimastix sp. JGI-2020a]ORY45803.1 hypothetical protein LY90DRAFT_671464 [Neocallimastix californiae]|eukprot:ORY45803.1 hypothetical protein LY90DRAFT_671464 [Neocallimastix californiae]
MDLSDKYPSELSDEDIIPFTADALEVVETVVSFFCDCLNKNEPKFITLLNGNLSPKKEDINLHPSLDGDPTEKICQETPLFKKPTVFKYGNPEENDIITEGNQLTNVNTSFDDCINNTDQIINKIEDDFKNKNNYTDSIFLSSDSEGDDDDGAPACVLAAKKEAEGIVDQEITSNNNSTINSEKKVEERNSTSKTNISNDDSNANTTPTPDEPTNELKSINNSSVISTSKSEDNNLNEEEETNSLDFPLDEGEKKEPESAEATVNESINQEEDNFDEGNFDDGNFDEDTGDFSNEPNSPLQQINGDDSSKEEEGIENHEEIDNQNEKVKFTEQTALPTPMPNLEEMSSKFSSQLSVTLNELEYYNNPNIYHDSNDEINFIPIQEKSNSNCVRWKYHIKHHSTNKKLRCSNFLIIWSQPTKINPVPKATAEMWMIYYHTSNVGRKDATITYRFNGYYNTHEINVHKFMLEYNKFKENPNVEITKKEFPTLYTPLVLNPKKWLPELIRSKLLISNEIMNKTLLVD